MEVVVNGRHCEVSDRFRAHVEEKLLRLEKHDHRIIRVQVEVEQERNPRQHDRSVRVELTAPSGDLWSWGPEDATQSVRGSAYDFCRLVTQRVHQSDTDLVAQGREATTWLGIAQCFAGPPGNGRGPGRG